MWSASDLDGFLPSRCLLDSSSMFRLELGAQEDMEEARTLGLASTRHRCVAGSPAATQEVHRPEV